MNPALVTNASWDGWSTGLGIINIGATKTSITVNYYDATTGTPVWIVAINILGSQCLLGSISPRED